MLNLQLYPFLERDMTFKSNQPMTDTLRQDVLPHIIQCIGVDSAINYETVSSGIIEHDMRVPRSRSEIRMQFFPSATLEQPGVIALHILCANFPASYWMSCLSSLSRLAVRPGGS